MNVYVDTYLKICICMGEYVKRKCLLKGHHSKYLMDRAEEANGDCTLQPSSVQEI